PRLSCRSWLPFMRPPMPLVKCRRHASAPVAAAAAPASAPEGSAEQAKDQEKEQQREDQAQESKAKAPRMETRTVAVVGVRSDRGIRPGLNRGHLAGLRHPLGHAGVVHAHPDANDYQRQHYPEYHSPDRSSLHRLVLVCKVRPKHSFGTFTFSDPNVNE